MPRRGRKPRELLDAIAKYWQGYASPAELEDPYLRFWSGQTLQRGMMEKAVLLLDALIAADTGPRRKAPSRYARKENLLYSLEHRVWNRLRISIIGVDSQENIIAPVLKGLIQDSARDSLCLCVLPSSFMEEWQGLAIGSRTESLFVLPIFPNDVNALARGYWSLLDLIEYKLYRIFLLEKDDVETQYGEVPYDEFTQTRRQRSASVLVDIRAFLRKLDDSPANWVDHPELGRLTEWIRRESDCLLVGPSSSGKSILALQAATKLSDSNLVKYADIGSLSLYDVKRALSDFLFESLGKGTVIIFDDLQSSPSIARYLLTLMRMLGVTSSLGKSTIIGITWPSYASEALREIPNASYVDVKPVDVQRALLAKYRHRLRDAEISTIADIAKDDVLLWRLMLETARFEGMGKADLAEDVWKRKIKGYSGDPVNLRRAAFVAALLGQYEFEISEAFLEYQADVSRVVISEMVRRRILRSKGNKVVLGHRSLCTLLAEWLGTDERIWAHLLLVGLPTQPIDIIHNYIRMADVSEVWTILRTLRANVGLRGGSSVSQRAQILADVWRCIDSLIERIEQQQKLDPTWNRNMASTQNCIEALCNVGKRESARPSIEFMRSQWSFVNGVIEVHKGSTERLDFDKICEHMKEEDSTLKFVRSAQRAEQIDLDKFHNTWVMGLVLCAEAAYAERTIEELRQLALAVESIHEPDGYFYPPRVPWCTARVLMGLARCGRSITNSDAVKKACEWLLGSAQDGFWESGTGSWNTPLEVTSMCIVALVMSGISPEHPKLRSALDYIVSKKSDWTRPEGEEDGTNAIRAYSATRGGWQGIVPEIQYFMKWAGTEAFWSSATKTAIESLEQSSRVALITNYITEVAWSNLRSDLPEFLAAFAVTPLPAPFATAGENLLPHRVSIVTFGPYQLQAALDGLDERIISALRPEIDRLIDQVTTNTAILLDLKSRLPDELSRFLRENQVALQEILTKQVEEVRKLNEEEREKLSVIVNDFLAVDDSTKLVLRFPFLIGYIEKSYNIRINITKVVTEIASYIENKLKRTK